MGTHTQLSRVGVHLSTPNLSGRRRLDKSPLFSDTKQSFVGRGTRRHVAAAATPHQVVRISR